jgi:hypothetical protein
MKGMYHFIVEPLNDRYNNKKEIDGQELILNTELQNHNFVSREGIVKYTPADNNTDISVGDKVIVHHNVFRRFRDIRGVEKNSKSYYEENTYFVQPDQIFAYKKPKKDNWNSCEGFNFIKPIKETDMFSSDFEKPLMGVLYTVDPKFSNLSKGDLVGFSPKSEYEFIIGEDRLYRVPTNSITIKYEYQGNEEEYNPSWASGS